MVDWFGSVVTGERAEKMRETPASPPDRMIGGSGVPLVNGRVVREYEHNSKLADGQFFTQVGHMLRAPMTATGVGMAKDLMKSATFPVERPKGASDEPAEYVRQALGLDGAYSRMDESFEDVLDRLLLGPLAYGPSVHELDLYEEDGRVWLHGLRYREPCSIWRWVVDEHERLVGVQQRPFSVTDASGRTAWDAPVIPANQLLTMHWGQTGTNFDGLSMLRTVWGEYRDRVKHAGLMVAGSQRFALPTPQVTISIEIARRVDAIPAGKSVREWYEAEEALARQWAEKYAAGERAFIVKPEWWVLDTYGGNNLSIYEMARAIEYYDRAILTGFLAQFLVLGAEGGSFALGGVLASTAQQRAVNVLEWVLKRFESVLERLLWWNFGKALKRAEYPTIRVEGIRAQGWVERLPELVSLMAAGAITQDDTTEATLRKGLGLPEAEAPRSVFDRTRTNPLATQAGQVARERRPLDSPTIDRGEPAQEARR